MLFKKKPVEPVAVVERPEPKYEIGNVLVGESEEPNPYSELYDRIAIMKKNGIELWSIIPQQLIQVKTTGTCIARRYDGQWFYTIAYDGFKTLGVEFAESHVYPND